MTTYDLIEKNKRKTVFLIALSSAVVLTLGYFVDRIYDAGGAFFVIAAVYALMSSLVSYYAGDKVALVASGAKEVTLSEAPQLVRMVENLCITSGMSTPKIHIIEDSAINAFATGRDPEHASIAVTTGAIQKLENEELEGVIAHELSHIKNYDIRVMTIVIILVGIVSIVANFSLHGGGIFGRGRKNEGDSGGILAIIGIVLILFSPLIAELIKLAVSRRREYLADASGVLLTRFPDGLARALQKISQENQPMRKASSATAHLFISNPFGSGGWRELVSTHPPIEKRIAALNQMGNVH